MLSTVCFAAHGKFKSGRDIALQAANYNFEIMYATGSVNGYVSRDTMSLGSPSITVKNQSFGLATSSTSDFLSTTCDGLFVSPLPSP